MSIAVGEGALQKIHSASLKSSFVLSALISENQRQIFHGGNS